SAVLGPTSTTSALAAAASARATCGSARRARAASFDAAKTGAGTCQARPPYRAASAAAMSNGPSSGAHHAPAPTASYTCTLSLGRRGTASGRRRSDIPQPTAMRDGAVASRYRAAAGMAQARRSRACGELRMRFGERDREVELHGHEDHVDRSEELAHLLGDDSPQALGADVVRCRVRRQRIEELAQADAKFLRLRTQPLGVVLVRLREDDVHDRLPAGRLRHLDAADD